MRLSLLLYIVGLLCLSVGTPAAAQPKSVTASTVSLAETSVYSTSLADVIKKAGLLPLLSNKGPYTFFAPSGDALQQLAAAEPEKARVILMGQIAEGKYTLNDLRDGDQIKTLDKQTHRVCRKKGKVMLDGVAITTADQQASNGVMHTVNKLFVSGQQNYLL